MKVEPALCAHVHLLAASTPLAALRVRSSRFPWPATWAGVGDVSDDREIIDLLGALAAIDSVNPSLVPGAAGEGEVAQQVVDWAGRAGLNVEILEETPGRPSVLVRSRVAGSGSGKSLMLCGHLD